MELIKKDLICVMRFLDWGTPYMAPLGFLKTRMEYLQTSRGKVQRFIYKQAYGKFIGVFTNNQSAILKVYLQISIEFVSRCIYKQDWYTYKQVNSNSLKVYLQTFIAQCWLKVVFTNKQSASLKVYLQISIAIV